MFEFHFGSVGIGMFVIIGVILALFAMVVLWKRYRRLQRRQLSRDILGEPSSVSYSARSPPMYNPAFQFPPMATESSLAEDTGMYPPPTTTPFLMPPMGFPPASPYSFPHPGPPFLTYSPQLRRLECQELLASPGIPPPDPLTSGSGQPLPRRMLPAVVDLPCSPSRRANHGDHIILNNDASLSIILFSFEFYD